MGNAIWSRGRIAAAFIALFPVLLIGGCTTVEPPASKPIRLTGVLTGTASYRERLALLPGTVMRVSLEDASRADASPTVVATTSSQIERQVPIPFTLAYDPAHIAQNHRYIVRAQIESANGRSLWTTTEQYGVITQGNADHVDVVLHPVRAIAEIKAQGDEDALNGRTSSYQCEGMFFSVRNAPGMVVLYLPDGYKVLPQVTSASGARYRDADTQFWSKGNEATLDVGKRHYAACKFDAARVAQEDATLRGVTLHASGSAPGWTLDIEKGRWLRFIGDTPGSSTYLPAQTSAIEGAKTIYGAKSTAHELNVVIERTSCTDTLSGKNFDAKATVTLDGRVREGCAQAVE
jgi:putative lipoprotein